MELAHILDEDFHLPPLPESFEFHEETISSDGPYPSDENYYTLDYCSYLLGGESGRGLLISFERFRRSGDDSITLETKKATTPIRSGIPKDATSPLAHLFLATLGNKPSQFQLDAIDAAVKRHHLRCGGG